jgi:hypothetical protein
MVPERDGIRIYVFKDLIPQALIKSRNPVITFVTDNATEPGDIGGKTILVFLVLFLLI